MSNIELKLLTLITTNLQAELQLCHLAFILTVSTSFFCALNDTSGPAEAIAFCNRFKLGFSSEPSRFRSMIHSPPHDWATRFPHRAQHPLTNWQWIQEQIDKYESKGDDVNYAKWTSVKTALETFEAEINQIFKRKQKVAFLTVLFGHDLELTHNHVSIK